MFHLYADDTQVYVSVDNEKAKGTFCLMELCITEIRTWMRSFIETDDNIEVLVVGSKYMLQRIPALALHIGNDTISPMAKPHIAHICKGAWYHLRQIDQIRQ